MTADEYDLLLMDPPSSSAISTCPRLRGDARLHHAAPFTGILEMYGVAFNFIPFGLPPVQKHSRSS